jgi:hypothetical protein
MSEDTKKPGACVMSLKRLKAIQDIIERHYGREKIDTVMAEITEGIKFNPDYRKGKYTPEVKEQVRSWRAKKAALVQQQAP